MKLNLIKMENVKKKTPKNYQVFKSHVCNNLLFLKSVASSTPQFLLYPNTNRPADDPTFLQGRAVRIISVVVLNINMQVE